MKYSHPQVQRTARRIPILCAVYFVAFVFCFLFFLQSDVLAQVHYQFSGADTVYHPVFGALLSTGLLTVLGIFINVLLSWLPLRAKASVWFFPFMLVGLLTHRHFPAFGDTGSSAPWWVYVILLIVYALWLAVCSMTLDTTKERGTFSFYAWPNALQLLLMTVMAVGLSNTDVVVHRTLRAAHLVGQGSYDEALACARWERHPSRQLSVATAFALSATHQMGDRLFAYPQPHGVAGLIPEIGDSVLLGNLPLAVGKHLGYLRGARTQPMPFLQVIDTMPNVQPSVRDYHLCALLLERNLASFTDLLLSSDTLSTALPLHYREALLLRQSIDTLFMPRLSDSLLSESLARFDSLRLAPGTREEREMRCRRAFPDSYWTYYRFSRHSQNDGVN